MKKINKDINKLILEIIFAVMVMIFTGAIWNINGLTSYSSTASMYDNVSIVELYVEDLETNNNALQSVELIVRNHGRELDKYKLLVAINKQSKLNIDNVYLNINGKLSKITDFKSFENQYNTFYILEDKKLNAYTQDEMIVDVISNDSEIISLYLTFVLDKGQFEL